MRKTLLLSQIRPLLFLTGIFFLNFLSRIVLSPLMPSVEKDLRMGHGEAGSLFFLISLGYCVMLLASGFVSSCLNHRKTIILSSIAVGGALFIVGFNDHLWGIHVGLLLLGMAAGLYLPSGIATLTELVSPEHWGKAISIHELAPNLGFVIAPLLTEALLGVCSWREVLMVLGVASIFAGFIFLSFGNGVVSHGEAPNVGTLRIVLKKPSFWIIMALFSLGIGGSFGVYSMFPLYLVSERGMDRAWANTLVGISRIFPLGMAILSGWVTDRLGTKQTLRMVFLTLGIITILLGVISGSWIVLIIFLQPMLASSFFPPGFAALSRIGGQRFKNVAISLTMPVSFLVGGGAIPAGIGLIGEARSFSLGFIILGGFFLSGVVLVQYLKFTED
jgi:NNP family nitrate/nitrite transporter-like MFS transporter